ncbi:OmpA family protein [Agarilytica rhodophyticola]|uniref:OmpA family protein n=1 Tax=Agarilytica rhodophyticola TaxID=1737490 RepID=UPI000B341BB3|nr:OmpA family protein [Agarilytica rhodophyticola]
MRIALISFLVLSMTACVSTDPYTGEQKASNTAKGAGIGAVTGAVIGALTSSKGDRDKGILTGAAAGAAIGGGVGFYMDKQEAKLRQRLQGSGVQVRRDGDNLHLIMPGNITFETAQYNIRSQFYPVLGSVSDVLKEFDKTAITVSGHTDSTGASDYNQTLSENRASSVKGYLVQKGIPSGRIHSVGYGKRRPIASNNNASGREQNRRVELKLEPIQ